MPELDKAQKLEERRRQRQQILSLLDTFPKFTDRSLLQMTRLRSRFLDVAGIDQQTQAAAFLTESTDRLRRLGEKATIVQRSLQAAAANTDEVLAHPEKLADNNIYGKDIAQAKAMLFDRVYTMPFDDRIYNFNDPFIREMYQEAGEKIIKKIKDFDIAHA